MDFNDALNFVLAKEGGLANNPADRGGVTNMGISQKAHPNIDVTKLTKDDAAKIYKAEYWDKIKAEELPPEMRLAAFDAAVQHGVGTAQNMVTKSDGTSGSIVAQRKQLYDNIIKNDPTQAQFQKGWNNRLQAVASTSQPLQSGNQADVEKMVSDMASHKFGPSYIIQKLSDAGYKSEIDSALQQGVSPEQIVAGYGGKTLETNKAAHAKVDAQGFITNVGKGASQAAQDVFSGTQQLVARATGDGSKLKQLQAEQAQLEADPTYQAQQDTVGSTIGGGAVKALPYIVGTALAPEATIPMLLANGAVGAASGALKPTTGDGQILSNIGTEAALGAGGAAAGALASKGIGALAGKVLGNNKSVAEFTARKGAADAAGLPSNAATLSGPNGFWRQVGDALPNNGSVQAFQAKADQTLAQKVAEGLGLKGYAGQIDHEMLTAAEGGIKAGLDNAASVSVVLPQSMKADLTSMINTSANPLTEGIATNSTVKQAVANLLKAVDNGAPVAGKALQDLNTELKALTQAVTGVSASEKALAGKLVGKINNTLTGAMTPEQAVAYKLANTQYTHLKAVENMVKASGDSGVVSPRQMINAVKTGRFKNSFFDGVAPYQDLAKTAQEMYGPSSGKGLASIIGKQLDTHSQTTEALALLNPKLIPLLIAKKLGGKALGALASSENPTIARMLAGGHGGLSSSVKNAMGKSLIGTGAVSATD